MGQLSKAIIVEDVLEKVFSFLPEMSFDDPSETYKVVFGYGDDIELNTFLANREASTVYPLVWMLYPQTEKHLKTKVSLNNVSFILAVQTNNEMENPERIKLTYSKILMPLFHNIRLLFRQSNVISVYDKEEAYNAVKYPNYSETELRDKAGTISIWDALKITVDLDVIQGCIKPIKFF